MGYRLNCLDEPVFVAGPKPMRTEFGIHHRLESCGKSKCVCIGGLRWPDIVSSKLLLQVKGDNVDKRRKQGLCNHLK